MSRTSCSKIALPKHFMLASFDVRRKCRADAVVCRSEPDIDPPALPTVGCLADLPFNKNWPCAFAPSQFYSRPSRTIHAAQDHPTKATRLTALGCGRAVGIATSRRQNEHNDRPYCVCACCRSGHIGGGREHQAQRRYQGNDCANGRYAPRPGIECR